jgi:hypothetical protein
MKRITVTKTLSVSNAEDTRWQEAAATAPGHSAALELVLVLVPFSANEGVAEKLTFGISNGLRNRLAGAPATCTSARRRTIGSDSRRSID